MSKIHIGINLEFVRHNDKPFEWGVEKAAELGYTHVEPMVHWGRELLSEAGYFHSVSMLDPFAYLSATQGLDKKPLEYSAGDKFSLTYLLTVYSENKSAEFLRQRNERWEKDRK